MALSIGKDKVSSFFFHNEKYMKSTHLHPDPPYLSDIKEPIDISVGRQLFVDEFLIQSTENVKTNIHKAEKIPHPVIDSERPDEGAIAAPLPGGVIYDPISKEFKIWYVANPTLRNVPYPTAIAKSFDGIHWYKPHMLGRDIALIEPCCKKTNVPRKYDPSKPNIIDLSGGAHCHGAIKRGSASRFMLPERKENRFLYCFGAYRKTSVYGSDNGMDWKKIGLSGYQSTCPWYTSYNPFIKKFVYTLRDNIERYQNNRIARYYDAKSETDGWGKWCHMIEGIGCEGTLDKNEDSPVYWSIATAKDKASGRRPPGIYTGHLVAYESIMLNIMSIYHGGESLKKHVDIHLGFSRDGFFYSRNYNTFIEESPTQTYLLPIGGNVLFVGDKVHFYFSSKNAKKGCVTTTGVATIRRDGFVSLQSENKDKKSSVTTKLLTVPYDIGYFFVNASCKKGSVTVEILNEDGKNILPESQSCNTDTTKSIIRWENNIKVPCDTPFRIRFHLKGDAQLFSFWVSRYESGESMGYLGNGGPDYTTYCDKPEEKKEEPETYQTLQYIIKTDKETMYIEPLPRRALSIVSHTNSTCMIRYADSTTEEFKLGAEGNITKIHLVL